MKRNNKTNEDDGSDGEMMMMMTMMMMIKLSVTQAGGEFCELQTLNATCRQRDEVVVMETALYGRMRLGSCVVADLGFVGCSRDVLSILDARCSGRRQCAVRVPDQDLAAIRPQPCLRELKSYLEASYRCQKGQLRCLHHIHACIYFRRAAVR